MTLPGMVRPSTGTTPESMRATVTPCPIKPSAQYDWVPVASATTWCIDPSSSEE